MSLKLHSVLAASFLGLLLSVPAMGQGPSFAWATQFGGPTLDLPRTICADASGNVFSGGKFSGTVTFSSTTSSTYTASGANDAFITKHDALGNFVWVKTFGATIDDEITSITTDASGNVYITGVFGGTTDFDPGPGVYNLTAANNDVFVLKLNAAGDFVWAAGLGGSSLDISASIAVDATGAVYTTGRFSGTADFDPSASVVGLTSAGMSDVFVSKLDPSGNYVWAVHMGGPQNDAGIRLRLDPGGDIVVTGHYRSTATFTTSGGTSTLTSSGSDDIFICRLNSSGIVLWAKSVGATQQDNVNSLELDADGNVYTLGGFNGSGDFDPGAGVASLTGTGTFISKLDAAGEFVWVKTIILPMGLILTKSMTITPWGTLNVAGIFAGTGDFDPGAAVHTVASGSGGTSPSLYVSSLTSSGDLNWIVTMEASDPMVALNPAYVYADASGGIYTIGNYNGLGGDLDPGAGVYALPHVGDEDVFVLKLTVNPLPIKIGKLSGRSLDNYNRLEWSTYTEQDNDGFYIERSSNGVRFEQIGFVPTKATQGNSKAQLDYSFEDRKALVGIVYYRLRNNNADGEHWYSNIVQLNSTKISGMTQIVPNPAAEKTYIIREPGRGSANVQILNVAGQVVQTVRHDDGGDIGIDVSALTAGSYFVQVTDAKGTEQLVLIKQ